ncbi:MAG TPA: hypothetical protein VK995_03865 [Oceanipulchritudo sp.]|nr:hypothetical protein [Oceanipulchritudo sp.]
MKLPFVLLTSFMALASTGIVASEMTVSIEGFADPTTFMITETSDLTLRVTELVPASGTNVSTHMLIEGLSPLEEGTSVYASTYSGINVDSGAVQDVGILYLDMPAGSGIPEGTVVSPIVGVVQRTGAWSGFSLTYPSTSVGGSSDPSASYQSGTISMTLIRDQETFIGSTSYTVVDQDTMTLEPFILTKDGTTSYNMSATTMTRDGDRFYGTLTNLSQGAAYDSLLFSIKFTGIPDLDKDGIPDISDSEVVAGLVIGDWNLTEIGWVYGYTPEWGYSLFMGFVYMDLPWIYQIYHGWNYLSSSFPLTPQGLGFFMYNVNDSWIYTQDNYGGFYWLIGTSNPAVWKDFLNPNP